MSSHSAEQVVIDWPERRLKADLGSRDIHVWAASLEGDADHWAKHLSTAELARAAAFHFELHRRRFIVGRGLLRLILSHYLNVRPEEVEFACTPSGKPELAGRFSLTGLRFNLAHSADLAIMAVTR